MSKFTAVIVTGVLSCCFSAGGTFLAMNAKIKRERGTFLATSAEIVDKIISLEDEIREIEESQQIVENTYNGIDVGVWVKTNDDYNRYVGKGKRAAGKVVELEDVPGEECSIATLKDGRRINTFWLVRMKTQRD